MKKMLRLSPMWMMVAAVALAAALDPVGRSDAAEGKKKAPDVRKAACDVFEKLPDKMPGGENDTDAKIELGKKLYFEKKISINETQSCNSCHRVDENLGGVDNLPTSKGAKGDIGGRNAPTTLNAGFHIAQFWDGRAPDLAAQAKGPVLNPIEMGMPNEEAVLAKLKECGYEELFKKAFPDDGKPLTYDNFGEAVAAFERTLITCDRFDDFLGGDDSALSKKEKRGLGLFMKVECADCHSGALLGGDRYEEMGEANAYANKDDVGRFEVTKKEEDKYVFKVPSLRNIAITGPYFHDGKAATLEDAIKQMGCLQLGKELKDKQVGVIAAFLGSLTDKDRIPKTAKK